MKLVNPSIRRFPSLHFSIELLNIAHVNIQIATVCFPGEGESPMHERAPVQIEPIRQEGCIALERNSSGNPNCVQGKMLFDETNPFGARHWLKLRDMQDL